MKLTLIKNKQLKYITLERKLKYEEDKLQELNNTNTYDRSKYRNS